MTLVEHKAKKYVFFCDSCETWTESNETMDSCPCGSRVRKLDGEELEEFFYKLSKSGYKIIPYKEKGIRYEEL